MVSWAVLRYQIAALLGPLSRFRITTQNASAGLGLPCPRGTAPQGAVVGGVPTRRSHACGWHHSGARNPLRLRKEPRLPQSSTPRAKRGTRIPVHFFTLGLGCAACEISGNAGSAGEWDCWAEGDTVESRAASSYQPGVSATSTRTMWAVDLLKTHFVLLAYQ